MSTETDGAVPRLVSVESSTLVRELQRLRTENAQLTQALQSRIVIEQAKGILRERYGLSLDASFELLRHAARSNRMNIHALASKVIALPETPAEFGRVRPPQERVH
jgi:AmiR/NasT family two-component response regulator